MRYLQFVVITFFSVCILSLSLNGQTSLDLSTIRVEELTDAQVQRFLQELKRSGLQDEDWERFALRNGMNQVELVKLKTRAQATRKAASSELERMNMAQIDTLAPSTGTKPIINLDQVFKEIKGKNFGSAAFNNPNITFEPLLNIPTPRNYILASGDELIVNVSGVSEANYKLKVSPEGLIRIPVAGPVQVSGLTIEAADRAIRNKLSSTIYSSLKTGRTKLDITLANIRSIRVMVIGEATVPGTYTLPSVATAYHALFACGGPSANGSFRDIQLIRNNKTIAVIDVYQFLEKGNRKSDLVLMDNDIIRINSYKVRVEIKGEVKRPGLYDVAENETFRDVLTYAGGYTDNAYTGKIHVYRNDVKDRKVVTVSEAELSKVVPGRGDVFIVNKILNRFSNRISISGAVFRPGDYELKKDMTLIGLLEEADGVREDAFMFRGTIQRLKDDLSPEIISFNVEKLLNKLIPDITLKKEDRIEIFSKFDLREGYYVKIDGEVLNPGTFLYAEGMKMQDLILMAGGLKESSYLNRVELSRRVKDTSSATSVDSKTATVFVRKINADLNDSNESDQIDLLPFDEVVVRSAPNYYVQKNVVIEGEIMYSGKYTLQSKDDRISDLIARAGGLSPFAYPEGAVLVRTRNLSKTEQANYEQGIRNLMKQSLSSGANPALIQAQALNHIEKKSDIVGIELETILENPKSEFDLFLYDGDTIRIPRQLQTVRVSGEVLYPTLVRYDEERTFKHYVINGGGFGDRAMRKRSYVVYPNGTITGTKSFLFFKNYPEISPGSEIFVPTKRERERLRAIEAVTLASTLVTMLAILFTTLR